jgi:hypothetical protein
MAGHGKSLFEILVGKVEGLVYLEDVGVDGSIKIDFKGIERGVAELKREVCTVLNRTVPYRQAYK